VEDVAKLKPQIESALAGQAITHEPIREIEVRMEEAFISLIRKKSSAVQSQKAKIPGAMA